MDIVSSLRATARGFRKAPGFFALAVLTLGLGIGGNSAIFTVVNAVLIQPLPYPEAERVVSVRQTAPGLGMDRIDQSDTSYLLYREHNKVLEELGIYAITPVTLTGGEEPERVESTRMTPSVFGVLRVPPALGRAFGEDESRPGAEPVAVISHGLWQRRFGGDRGVIGKTVRVDGVERRIVGVMPEEFRFPGADTVMWTPFAIDPARTRPTDFHHPGVGRLRPGVSVEQATRDLSALVSRMPEVSNGELSPGMIEQSRLAAVVRPLRDEVVGDMERSLWLLLGSVGVLLLIACVNVANLYLVRAESRQREMAVRTAIGASRRQIAGVFLGESLTLALLGGLVGLGLAVAGVRLLAALEPPGIPRLSEIGVDAGVVAFTMLLSLLAGLFIGGFAAFRYGSPELVPSLKEGGRGGTAGRARHRARQALVVVQVALALVLLVGSGLMVKSFWRLASVDPGFDAEGVLTVRIDLPEAEYPDLFSATRYFGQVLERLRALPEVGQAGAVNALPLSGGGLQGGHNVEDNPVPPGSVPHLLGTRIATPGYFEAMDIRAVEGRTFDRMDPQQRSGEAVVSRALAERFWPGRSALGKRLAPLGNPEMRTWFTIVGVVESVREQGLNARLEETVYYPLLRLDLRPPGAPGGEWVPRSFSVAVKARPGVDPLSLAGKVRQTVWSLDSAVPLSQMSSMEQVVERSMARVSFTMFLLAVGAVVALLLGAVGIYGVISYVVSQRTQEIGVRMALGAKKGDVSGMVLKEGLVLALLGIGFGLAGALAATRLMRELLFEVSPNDPATFAAVPVLLAAVALLASYLPARRAAGVAPLEAIRNE